MNLVITMSRRFGTGASIIAKELSERLHIPVYDKDDVEHGMRENAFESEADAGKTAVYYYWTVRFGVSEK